MDHSPDGAGSGRAAPPAQELRIGLISPQPDFGDFVQHTAGAPMVWTGYAATAAEALPLYSQCSHIILDLNIVNSTEALAELLAPFTGYVLAVAQPAHDLQVREAVAQTPGVSRVVVPAELPAALQQLRPESQSYPRFAEVLAPAESTPAAPHPVMGGWKCIAVWGLEGGVGKTRLTRALGQNCVRRGQRALAIGLGCPDVLPLGVGLDPTPNLGQWLRHPQPDVLQRQVQADGDLDLLAGFLSPPALDRFAAQALQGETSLSALTMQTAHLGYAGVLLDVSAQELARPALQCCTALVLLGTATAQGAVAAVEAFRLAHREVGLPAAQIHLVLNRWRPRHLSQDQFLRIVRTALKEIPDPIVVLAEEETPEEARAPRPGAPWGGPAWNQSVARVGDLLFGGTETAPAPDATRRFGPLVFRSGA